MASYDFEGMFEEQTRSLRNFALNLTKNTEEANDLYQETAFRAYSNREKFSVGTNFKAWLMTIMKNIFINNYRKKSNYKMVNDNTDNLFYLNSGMGSIENSGETEIFMEELYDMIEHLDDSLRIPFQLHYEGFKYQDIADQLELPLGTIKSRIFFARKELKEKIMKKYNNIYQLTSRVNKKIG